MNSIRHGSTGLALSVSLIGCDHHIGVVTLHPRVMDRPEKERVELFYTNDTGHFLCFDKHSWPTGDGKLDFARNDTALVVGGQRFPIDDNNNGFCLGSECELRVAPNATQFGFLPYSDFHLPVALRYETKRLEHTVKASDCDPAEHDSLPKLRLRKQSGRSDGRMGSE